MSERFFMKVGRTAKFRIKSPEDLTPHLDRFEEGGFFEVTKAEYYSTPIQGEGILPALWHKCLAFFM